MAIPFQIQIGRISRFLSKWASTKGSSPVITIGSEITPMLPMWSGVENRYLDSWYRYGIIASPPAGGVGNVGGLELRNPTGSGIIAVVEQILFSNTVNDSPNVIAGQRTTDLQTSVFPKKIDARQQSDRSMLVTTINDATHSGGGVGSPAQQLIMVKTILANTSCEFIDTDDQELPILPGDAINVASNVTNSAIPFITVIYRERGLEESERT